MVMTPLAPPKQLMFVWLAIKEGVVFGVISILFENAEHPALSVTLIW